MPGIRGLKSKSLLWRDEWSVYYEKEIGPQILTELAITRVSCWTMVKSSFVLCCEGEAKGVCAFSDEVITVCH